MDTTLKPKTETALHGVTWRVKNLGTAPVRIKARGEGRGMKLGVLLQPSQILGIRPPQAVDAYCEEDGLVESDFTKE